MALQQYLIWPNVPHQIPYNINISCDQRVANFVNAMAGYLVYTVQEKGHTNAARSACLITCLIITIIIISSRARWCLRWII